MFRLPGEPSEELGGRRVRSEELGDRGARSEARGVRRARPAYIMACLHPARVRTLPGHKSISNMRILNILFFLPIVMGYLERMPPNPVRFFPFNCDEVQCHPDKINLLTDNNSRYLP